MPVFLPSTVLPINPQAVFDGMIKILVWCMALPDSVLGTGIAVVLLLGVMAIRRFRGPRDVYGTNLGDFAAIAYVGLQFVTLPSSVSYPNTVHFITPAVIALCTYLAVRLLPFSAVVQTVIFRIAVCFGLLLAIADLVAFNREVHLLDSFPRSSLAALHANLPLIGGPTQNDSIMLVLALLPFALASWARERGRNRYFSVVGLVVAAALASILALSFSRGIYLAFAVFVVGALILMKYNGSGSLRLTAAFCLIVSVPAVAAIAYFGVGRAVVETVGSKTTAEQRSTMGRIVTFRDSLSAIKEHPLLGTGGYSDGLASLAWLKESPDRSFTARTYNAPLEASLSSGLLGLLSYAILLLYPIVKFIRARGTSTDTRQTTAFSFLTVGVVALMVRDLTYSSLVLDGRTMVIAWIAAALLQNSIATPRNEVAGEHDRQRRWSYGMAFVTIGLTLFSMALSIPLTRAENQYKHGAAQFMRGDYTQAGRSFQNAIDLQRKQPMFYAARALAAFRVSSSAVIPPEPWRELPVVTTADEALLGEAAEDYRRALALSKNDATFWSNLGWIEAYRRHDPAAFDALQTAVTVEPQDTASRIGLGLCEERRGMVSEALEQYAQALASSPRLIDSSFFVDLKARNPSGAPTVIARCMEILRAMPSSPIVLASVAKIHAYQGQNEAASREYTAALQELPDLAYAWANLGAVDLAAGKTAPARSDFQRALDLYSWNRFAANKLAAMAFASGDMPPARKLYIRTLLTPLLSVHANRVGRVYHVPWVDPDDLIPSGLLEYVNPPIEPLRLCGRWLDDLSRTYGGFSLIRNRIEWQQRFCAAQAKNAASRNK